MNGRPTIRSIAAFALVSLATVGVVGTAPPQFQPTGPSISMDFLALTSDGRPVRDLKPEDLTVRMDRKSRNVKSLQLVPVADAPGSGFKTGGVDIPPAFDTNVLSRKGRAIAIVIDDESLRIGEERPVREATAKLLAELPPTDAIALFTVPHGGLKSEFTTNREKTMQALSQIVGQTAPNRTPQDAAIQTRTVLEQLAGTLNSLSGNPGPTTVVVMTAGLVGPRSDTIRSGQTVGVAELTPEHFQNVANAVADARAQFYLVQPANTMIAGGDSGSSTALFGGNTNPMVGLEHLAGVTGGQVLHLAGVENVLSRIARETSAYYEVTFDADPSDRNGRTHTFELKVARSDVTVRVRPTVTMARADTGKPTPKTAKDTLRTLDVSRDVPMRSVAFSSRNTGDDKMKVAAVFEPLDPAASITSAVAGLYDTKGTLTGQWTARPEDLTTKPFLAGMLVPAGTYRLRVATSDAAGHVGSVDSSVSIELTPAGPLKLSSLVLGLPRTGGGFAPALEFSTEPTAIVFFEMYGGKAQMNLGAAIEIADSVNGPALLQLGGADIKWGATPEPDKFTATAQLPIASLKPGDYVIRAIVGLEGQPEGRVIRTLHKR